MNKLVIFREHEKKHGAFLFVKSYRRKHWFSREKAEYSIEISDAHPFIDNEEMADVCEKVKKDYPEAEIYCEDYKTFTERFYKHRFWVIGRWSEDGTEEFYEGSDQNNKPTYTKDLDSVRFMLSQSSANETLNTIRSSTRDMAYTRPVFLTLENELLSPCMMITCTSKRSGNTKYFSKLDGNRLRLVGTSKAATLYSYEVVIQIWEHLRQHNKNFLYAVLPAFADNVPARNIETYMKSHNVSRMVVMDLQLRFLNR